MSAKVKFLPLFLFLILLVSGCNLPANQPKLDDPNIIFTAAAQTAAVQLTEAAANNAPTATPLPPLLPPTMAPQPTSVQPLPTSTVDNCDKAKFIADVTILDGTVFPPGESFTKTWRVRNIGTCTWTSDYALVFASGEQMGGVSPRNIMGSVAPGDTVDISVNLVSPATDGEYRGNWQIRNSSNVLFAKIYVQIEVSSGEFAVTGVNDIVSYAISGHGMAFTAKIRVNKAGKVEYHWIIRESGQADLRTDIEKINFASGGTEDISTLWAGCPHTGDFKASLYIDEPNHQEFGQTNFSCP